MCASSLDSGELYGPATINKARIDELLEFLPLFREHHETLEPVWQTATEDDIRAGYLVFPLAIYPAAVQQFFTLAGQPCWSDQEYVSKPAADLLRDDRFIAKASLSDIQTLLTFCVRGERFCDGHWAALIREGRITAILHRLEILRALEGL